MMMEDQFIYLFFNQIFICSRKCLHDLFEYDLYVVFVRIAFRNTFARIELIKILRRNDRFIIEG